MSHQLQIRLRKINAPHRFQMLDLPWCDYFNCPTHTHTNAHSYKQPKFRRKEHGKHNSRIQIPYFSIHNTQLIGPLSKVNFYKLLNYSPWKLKKLNNRYFSSYLTKHIFQDNRKTFNLPSSIPGKYMDKNQNSSVASNDCF